MNEPLWLPHTTTGEVEIPVLGRHVLLSVPLSRRVEHDLLGQLANVRETIAGLEAGATRTTHQPIVDHPTMTNTHAANSADSHD